MSKKTKIKNKKLNLNQSYLIEARKMAKKIVLEVQDFINQHTTITIERTICRLFGIDGVDEFGVPLPNVVVDYIMPSHHEVI